MSHTQPTAAPSSSSSSSNFQIIFDNALDTYKTRTRNDLRAHPLVAQLQTCDSPTAILAVLQQQVQGLDQSQSADERWTKWLDPTISVLSSFSDILGAGVSLVFSPASAIFAGVGILLSAVKDVRASHDTLVDIFERIELFFRRLEIYTKVQPTWEMMNIIIQIMAEVLCILGIATKEIKQGRIKKYAKKLAGRTDIEDALKRLDKLTHEEAWMGIAQNLKATHAVGENVREVVDKVLVVNNNVAGVDDRVAGVSDRVASVDDKVKVVDDRVAEVIRDGKEAKVVMQQTATDVDQVKVATQQTATDVDQMKRNQLRESVYRWLSPPDPSTTHYIARDTHHKKPASWFFQGGIFQEWKSTGSLLWIHGKPGSGKSVLCSTVIQDIEAMCEAGNASMAYFYFDFREANKQGLRDLLTSLLTQLSAPSGPHCDILTKLFSAHDEGKKQPSDNALAKCLKEMLSVSDQHPTYLIIDALDESPNSSGIPSPRERVLHLLKELVELCLPDLHICVTSRPETDIRDVLEPLTSRRVSLHDQTGQKQDIVDYVKSVVYSNSEPFMRRWRTEDKELVIKVLSERADGMFRWIFCQLEVLRYCLPSSVRHTLDELPETLDETYERVLKEIKKPNRVHAIRLLQCLVVAIRPLQVGELAEVLAVDFGDEEGIPKLNPNWRWGDEEQAILASCSSLITIVESDESRVVQFSHFSVKEYLTSDRLATSSGDISRYHIDLQPAHTILAQACMGVLLRSDVCAEDGGGRKISPLAGYAAEHWVVHAQDEKVSSRIRKAVEYLFDVDKPYFAAWLELYDIDTNSGTQSTMNHFKTHSKSGATPLYYAAWCGFQDLVEHLVACDPKQVNAIGGHYVTPLVAALAARHFQTAQFLYENDAHSNVKGHDKMTPLHSAAYNGDFEMVQILLKYKADVHARSDMNKTPLIFASGGYGGGPNNALSHSNVIRLLLERGAHVNARDFGDYTPLHEAAGAAGYGSVIRVLLEHGADINARSTVRMTPLHKAAEYGNVEAIRVLLEHGADINAQEQSGYTPLCKAAEKGRVEAIRVLLELGADVNVRKDYDAAPLHEAARTGKVEAIRVLLELGADVDTRGYCDSTPLYKAAGNGKVEAIRVLLELGADVNARTTFSATPLHYVVQSWSVEAMQVLLEHGADVNARNYDGSTPLHEAALHERVEAIRTLLEHGADVNARNDDDATPLHMAPINWKVDPILVLLEHGAEVNVRMKDGSTPFHRAVVFGSDESIHVLLEHGADVNARTNDDTTPLHEAAGAERAGIVRMLVEHGADVNARKNDDTTPLHEVVAREVEWTDDAIAVIRVLLEHGADVNARKNDDTTPLHEATRHGETAVIRVLVELGADVNARKDDDTSPLHIAAREWVHAVRVLVEHGADVNVRKNDNTTPLHEAAQSWWVDAMRMLLERGADVNARKNDDTTPLHEAARNGTVEAIRVLLEHGADVNARKNDDTTPLHEAARDGRVRAIRVLLENGANIAAEDGCSNTALQVAQDDEIKKLLSEYVGK